MRKKALITGITGQDGSYLAELLLKKGYEVHGLVRRSHTLKDRWRIEHLYTDPDHEKDFFLHYGDMIDSVSLMKVITTVNPDEIYNLAAQSHVQVSWDVPVYTAMATGLGLLNLLETVRMFGLSPKIYQASTSELYSGNPEEAPQNEKTPFRPRSPYAVAKLYAHELAEVYRKAYGMFISCGILFNHESPRRGENFVTRKIAIGVADIKKDKTKKIYLGNLDSQRDWGYAPEYVESMWRMLQQEEPNDYVVATGETHTVKEFLIEAFKQIGIENWQDYVVQDPRFIRPIDVNCLCGDYSKAKRELGWEPKTKFKELVKLMVQAEL